MFLNFSNKKFYLNSGFYVVLTSLPLSKLFVTTAGMDVRADENKTRTSSVRIILNVSNVQYLFSLSRGQDGVLCGFAVIGFRIIQSVM